MADIELVIKISEEMYKDIQSRDWKNGGRWYSEEWKAIHNGTPLPKGHGRLIDADEIQFENAEFDTYDDYCIAFDAIDQADTIIEADKEGSMTLEEINRIKFMVCCPMCDNKKCVRGTDSCEAEQWAKSKEESEVEK